LVDVMAHTIEIDMYAGRPQGLAVADVELASVAAASAFEAPSWFGPEVTDEPRYWNAALGAAERTAQAHRA
jgi:adenylate cyclase